MSQERRRSSSVLRDTAASIIDGATKISKNLRDRSLVHNTVRKETTKEENTLEKQDSIQSFLRRLSHTVMDAAPIDPLRKSFETEVAEAPVAVTHRAILSMKIDGYNVATFDSDTQTVIRQSIATYVNSCGETPVALNIAVSSLEIEERPSEQTIEDTKNGLLAFSVEINLSSAEQAKCVKKSIEQLQDRSTRLDNQFKRLMRDRNSTEAENGFSNMPDNVRFIIGSLETVIIDMSLHPANYVPAKEEAKELSRTRTRTMKRRNSYVKDLKVTQKSPTHAERRQSMQGLNLEGVSDGVLSAAIVYQEGTKLPIEKLGGILKPIDRKGLKVKVAQHIKRTLQKKGRGSRHSSSSIRHPEKSRILRRVRRRPIGSPAALAAKMISPQKSDLETAAEAAAAEAADRVVKDLAEIQQMQKETSPLQRGNSRHSFHGLAYAKKELKSSGNMSLMDELRAVYDKRHQQEQQEDEDGDIDEEEQKSLYTDKALLQREALRFDPELQRTMGELFDLVDTDKSNTIEKEEYVILSHKVYIAIRSFWDPSLPKLNDEEMLEIADSDWESDSQGCEFLNRERFLLSVFELADVWVDFICGETYVLFLQELLEMLSEVVEDSGDEESEDEDESVDKASTPSKKKERKVVRSFRSDEAIEARGKTQAQVNEDEVAALFGKLVLSSKLWNPSNDLASMLLSRTKQMKKKKKEKKSKELQALTATEFTKKVAKYMELNLSDFMSEDEHKLLESVQEKANASREAAVIIDARTAYDGLRRTSQVARQRDKVEVATLVAACDRDTLTWSPTTDLAKILVSHSSGRAKAESLMNLTTEQFTEKVVNYVSLHLSLSVPKDNKPLFDAAKKKIEMEAKKKVQLPSSASAPAMRAA